jgi:hypothetical protein
LELIQNKEYVFFTLKELRSANGFVSVQIKNHQGSFISGDHCQAGSGGKIYEIKGYSLKDGLQIIKNINGNSQKGGVSKKRKTLKRFKNPTKADMFLDYIATGREDLVEDYLDKGGDPKVRNCKGETALHIAVAHNENKILERILPYFNDEEIDIRDMYGLPAYMTAIKHGNEYGTQLLSQYHKIIRTKPYRFKNYNFENNNFENNNINIFPDYSNEMDNLIIDDNKIASKINQNSLNRLAAQFINTSKKTKMNRKNKTVKKRETIKSALNRINKIIRIENLPEELQYLPKGLFKNKKEELGHNNTQLKQVIFNNSKKSRRTKKKLAYDITRLN